MIIKKFLGKTEEEAMEAARKELGSGVVVMNVRTVKKKGIAGIFGAKQIEVTVALEEEGGAVRPARKDAVRSEQEAVQLERKVQDAQAAVNVMSESSQNIEKKLDSLQTLLVSRFRQEEDARAEQAQQDEAASEEEKESGAAAQDKEPTEQE